MADILFPILGPDIPTLCGREKIMNRLVADLTKESPSHLSIVGPRFSGKSVIMKALYERMAKDDSPYNVVIAMDLGHQTPEDDASFLKLLCKSVGDGIRECCEDYSQHLLMVKDNEYDDLREVISALESDGIKILFLWDGFDKVLAKGLITRNLWDQLRELASSRAIRLVTASRKTLHESIRSEESSTSDFWNIFDMNPVKVSVFDEQDKQDVLALMPELKFSSGALSEIENWSALYPPLFIAILNQLVALKDKPEVTNADINDVASNTIDNVTSILSELWKDCPETAKDVYRDLCKHGEKALSDIGIADRNSLSEKGFITVTGNKVKAACRFLESYVATLNDDVGSITRLFGKNSDYQDNIRSVLELRLNQVADMDERLKRKIQRSIEDIPDHAEDCIENIRGIIDRALDLIWLAELGEKKEIPIEWFGYWSSRQEKGPEHYWENKFPTRRGHEIRLLHLLTGTQNSVAKAKHVTKNTYALASALQGFGDFGQHLEGAKVPMGVAVSSVMMSIELASLVASELKN